MKVKINTDYKCVMLLPNINFWYEDDEPKYIFIGWLKWGINIVFGDPVMVKSKSKANSIAVRGDK